MLLKIISTGSAHRNSCPRGRTKLHLKLMVELNKQCARISHKIMFFRASRGHGKQLYFGTVCQDKSLPKERQEENIDENTASVAVETSGLKR